MSMRKMKPPKTNMLAPSCPHTLVLTCEENTPSLMTLIAPPISLSSKYLVSRCFGTPKSLLRRCLGVQTPIVNRYDDRKSTDVGVRKPLPRFRLRNLVEKDCLERNCASCNYHHQEHEGQDHPIWAS